MGQGSLRGGTRGNGGEQGEPEGQGGVTVPGSVGLGARPFPLSSSTRAVAGLPGPGAGTAEGLSRE